MFKILPQEICDKIYNYIDFRVPGAVAIKTAKIREIKLNELFSTSPPTGSITINESDSDSDSDIDEWLQMDAYWLGFYAANGIHA